jgi:O-antigen/teichoic acid export membrane protein
MRAYGAGFEGGTGAFVILLASAAVAAPLKVIGQAIAGAGRMWVAFGLNVPWAAALISTTYLLRSRGAVGLATAYLVAYLVQFGLSIAFATRLVRASAVTESAHAS